MATLFKGWGRISVKGRGDSICNDLLFVVFSLFVLACEGWLLDVPSFPTPLVYISAYSLCFFLAYDCPVLSCFVTSFLTFVQVAASSVFLSSVFLWSGRSFDVPLFQTLVCYVFHVLLICEP